MTVVATVGGGVLLGLWVSHLRRDLLRRQDRHRDWIDGGGGMGIWTSEARCPECTAAGAVLAREHGDLWHICMACGHRHRRSHKG